MKRPPRRTSTRKTTTRLQLATREHTADEHPSSVDALFALIAKTAHSLHEPHGRGDVHELEHRLQVEQAVTADTRSA